MEAIGIFLVRCTLAAHGVEWREFPIKAADGANLMTFALLATLGGASTNELEAAADFAATWSFVSINTATSSKA